MTPEEITARAQQVRDGGVPDVLNRWIGMTPERLEEIEANLERLRRGRFQEPTKWKEKEHVKPEPKTLPPRVPRARLDQILAAAQGRAVDAALLGPDLPPITESPSAPAPASGGEVPDFTAHKHPVLAVACPACGVRAGAWCKRPSGHRAGDLHADRCQAADAAWEKSGLPLITQVGPGKFVYDPPTASAPAKPAPATAAQPEETEMAKTATKKTSTKTPAKTARKAPATPRAKKAAAPAAKANARTPVSARPDGLREGSKLAKLLDTAVAAGPEGMTEADLCKKIGGWKACAVTLRRVCERVGAKCERKDGKFVVTLPAPKG